MFLHDTAPVPAPQSEGAILPPKMPFWRLQKRHLRATLNKLTLILGLCVHSWLCIEEPGFEKTTILSFNILNELDLATTQKKGFVMKLYFTKIIQQTKLTKHKVFESQFFCQSTLHVTARISGHRYPFRPPDGSKYVKLQQR